MQDIPDDVLIKASEGDVEAFEAVYKATAGFVYNVAFRVVANEADAKEVTQEVFWTVYRKLKDFRFESSFKTWVYRITVNGAINYAKKTNKEGSRMVEYDENMEVSGTLPETEGIDREDQKKVIDSLLKVLNPEQKACVVLRNLEGLSYQEIADVLKININTVRSRLKRAREKMVALRKKVNCESL